MELIAIFAALFVGMWFGALAMYWRLGTRSTYLTEWEDDLRDRQKELERLFDVVADESKKLHKAKREHERKNRNT